MTDYRSMGAEKRDIIYVHWPPGLDGDVGIGLAASTSPNVSMAPVSTSARKTSFPN